LGVKVKKLLAVIACAVYFKVHNRICDIVDEQSHDLEVVLSETVGLILIAESPNDGIANHIIFDLDFVNFCLEELNQKL
jgi:hypothetical protein